MSRSMPTPPEPGARVLLGEHLERAGVSRRAFVSLCTKLLVTAPVFLTITSKLNAEEVADDLAKAERPSVIWLHFQDCTGCSESLLRTSAPDVATLITEVISLDYHETLMAASGHQAEEARKAAMRRHKGKYVLVVEGSIPTKEQGRYMLLAGVPALQLLEECARDAAAVIAIGSCASFGGLPAVGPDPTGATGVDEHVKDRPVVNIPGCPPNPYTLLATVLEFARHGTLPALDDQKRPRFAYDRVIHDHCPRRGHFDAGRFASEFGDEGHREGWCLYKLGCKGPETHAPCSVRHFNEIVDAWPIGIGAPCVGCTEKALAFQPGMFDTIPIKRATPPDTYPSTIAASGELSPFSVGLTGLAIGAAIGGTAVASQHYSRRANDGGIPGDAPRGLFADDAPAADATADDETPAGTAGGAH